MKSNEFFSQLERILNTRDIQDKYALFCDVYEDFSAQKLCITPSAPLLHIPPYTPAVFRTSQRTKSASLDSPHGLARAVHAIAHIEYSAITLALDSAYRFRYLPRSYYEDWLEVAKEEFSHFFLLEGLLQKLGVSYGDFSVNEHFYLALARTEDSLLYRMGVVHRGLEARGLDANPFVLQKFSSINTPICRDMKKILEVILRDEIGHVGRGDRWWHFAIECARNVQAQAHKHKQKLQQARLQKISRTYKKAQYHMQETLQEAINAINMEGLDMREYASWKRLWEMWGEGYSYDISATSRDNKASSDVACVEPFACASSATHTKSISTASATRTQYIDSSMVIDGKSHAEICTFIAQAKALGRHMMHSIMQLNSCQLDAFMQSCNKPLSKETINANVEQEGIQENMQIFLALCMRFSEFILCGKVPNMSARLACGFCKEEVEQMGKLYAHIARMARYYNAYHHGSKPMLDTFL